MISPYVRRLRLGAELRALRAAAGLTHEQVAKKIGESRAQISRLENGHVVDLADVMKILDALGVDGDRWTQVVTIAREAGEKGWWESTRGMGERSALYANLEAGAAKIREYQQTFMPGLLQIPEFVRARIAADATLEPMTYTVDGVLAGNAGRQRMLRRPGAPSYEVIIDELAVRRLAAPPDVVKKQLYHLATASNGTPAVALRVLPVDVRVDSFTVPRCAFSIYTYPDPGDPASSLSTPSPPTWSSPNPPRSPPTTSSTPGSATRHCPPPTASTCSPRPPPNSPTDSNVEPRGLCACASPSAEGTR